MLSISPSRLPASIHSSDHHPKGSPCPATPAGYSQHSQTGCPTTEDSWHFSRTTSSPAAISQPSPPASPPRALVTPTCLHILKYISFPPALGTSHRLFLCPENLLPLPYPLCLNDSIPNLKILAHLSYVRFEGVGGRCWHSPGHPILVRVLLPTHRSFPQSASGPFAS